eukprot:1159249-Pelagomonas_calceolata.AAC.3
MGGGSVPGGCRAASPACSTSAVWSSVCTSGPFSTYTACDLQRTCTVSSASLVCAGVCLMLALHVHSLWPAGHAQRVPALFSLSSKPQAHGA